MKYLNSDLINLHREQVLRQSRAAFEPVYHIVYAAIDALLFIQYAYTVPNSGKTVEPLRSVQNLAQKWLYASVFSFHASMSLAEQGFYSQSLSLNRTLMENVFTASYLADKPHEVNRLPRLKTKVTKRLRMRERFEHVIPRFYDLGYGFSSEFAHPSHASYILKIQPDGKGAYAVDLGISFSEKWMSMCLNEIVMLLASFLKTYVIKFKSVLRYRDSSHLDAIRSINVELLKYMYGHIALKGEETDWHKHTRPLWDWN